VSEVPDHRRWHGWQGVGRLTLQGISALAARRFACR
jgi:hypothetical protein